MSLLEIILIGFGLAMDAFAVSITLGLSVGKIKTKELIIPGIYFGFFQALMPAIGFFIGIYFVYIISNFEHWITFILLGFIGGKMIKDSLSLEKEEKDINKNVFRFMNMLFLAIATSLDALAVGVTLAFYKVNIIMAAMIIGLITFFTSICGVKIGNIFGIKFKSRAEFIGGTVLVLLGLKFVIEHFIHNR